MQKPNMRYGRFLRTKRLSDDRELTLRDVADALGVSVTFVSDVEHGRRLPYDEIKTQKRAAKKERKPPEKRSTDFGTALAPRATPTPEFTATTKTPGKRATPTSTSTT